MAQKKERQPAPSSSHGEQLSIHILNHTGEVGRRMGATIEELRSEFLRRTPHAFLEESVDFTEEILPIDLFIRKDGKTPYLKHSLRVTLDVQDFLLRQRGIDPFKMTKGITDLTALEIVTMASSLMHDDIEEPQEKHIKGKLGGLTYQQIKDKYWMRMGKFLPDLSHPTWIAMNIFNRWYPDDTKKSDEIYNNGITEATKYDNPYSWVIKAIDAQDSPQGDLAFLTDKIEQNPTVPFEIFNMLDKPQSKLDKIVSFITLHTPSEIQESFEATRQALVLFPTLALQAYPEKIILPTLPSSETTIFTSHGQE